MENQHVEWTNIQRSWDGDSPPSSGLNPRKSVNEIPHAATRMALYQLQVSKSPHLWNDNPTFNIF